jgi:hypothetical protein
MGIDVTAAVELTKSPRMTRMTRMTFLTCRLHARAHTMALYGKSSVVVRCPWSSLRRLSHQGRLLNGPQQTNARAYFFHPRFSAQKT